LYHFLFGVEEYRDLEIQFRGHHLHIGEIYRSEAVVFLLIVWV